VLILNSPGFSAILWLTNPVFSFQLQTFHFFGNWLAKIAQRK
jgi:hypothetical protein